MRGGKEGEGKKEGRERRKEGGRGKEDREHIQRISTAARGYAHWKWSGQAGERTEQLEMLSM